MPGKFKSGQILINLFCSLENNGVWDIGFCVDACLAFSVGIFDIGNFNKTFTYVRILV